MTPEEQSAAGLNYEPVRTFEMAGGWGGLTICKRCGLAIYLDPTVTLNVMEIHEAFHARVDPR